MRRISVSFAALAFSVAVGLSASGWAYAYEVKAGDTLSKIAAQTLSPPVYGKNGGLARLLRLNPRIKIPDRIYPGERIEVARDQKKVVNTKPALITKRSLASDETPPTINADSTPHFQRGAQLAITPDLALSTLSAQDRITGASSTVASQYNLGVNLAYIQEWSTHSRSSLSLGLGMVSFEPPTDRSKNLVEGHKFVSSIGLGADFDLGSRWNFELSAAYDKKLFVRAATTTSVAIDAVSVPSLGGKLTYELLRLDPFAVGISAHAALEMPAQTEGYPIRLGKSFGGTMGLRQQMGAGPRSNAFESELGFYQRTQDTDFSRQTETSLVLKFRIFFAVGRRQQTGM